MYEIKLTESGREKLALSSIDKNTLQLANFTVSNQSDDYALSSVIFEQPINQVDVRGDEILVSCVIPETVEDVWLKFIAIFDDKNEVIACGNLPEFYKPKFEVSPSICNYLVKFKYANADQLTIDFDSQAYVSKKDYYQLSASVIQLMSHHIAHIWPKK
ncbi:MAG: hypothetical protein EP298_04025 [Gammaproteobacteria bacterium]|nr:MAG: hypothetical protein EP298_04025 [Gammaproteobacteria bacterium]UTW43797.1 phage tail protein [bacterium SCSIO 12844]